MLLEIIENKCCYTLKKLLLYLSILKYFYDEYIYYAASEYRQRMML